MEQKQGIIAILDALGAASYGDQEIAKFLESRERVLKILQDKVHTKEVRGLIEQSSVSTFTFNDTVLIIFCTPEQPSLEDTEHFGLLMRKFMVDSLAQGILFRGSLSIGKFYVSDESNTVMGEAVTDAAAWYDSADWMGINATPQATMIMQALIEQSSGNLDRIFVDYDVPFKDRASLSLKVVNWPKGFYVKGVQPITTGEKRRAKCLTLLANHGLPKGAEQKHFNTLKFFDHCSDLWAKEERRRKKAKNK